MDEFKEILSEIETGFGQKQQEVEGSAGCMQIAPQQARPVTWDMWHGWEQAALSSALSVLVAVFMLSCSFPRRPDFGDVTVMDLHSGGIAHFHCHLGYELQGPHMLTCINASRPHWSSPEPICSGVGIQIA